MGLLDDAIREHLELKRRHGASEEELTRKEAEALGPARRDFPAPAAEHDLAEAPDLEEHEQPGEEPVPFEDAPASEDEEEEPLAGESGPSSGSDDVLEETPEFLQDAPDHDRLWFEQKPPRDFDFE
jgi:hypothetical protein